MGIEFEEKVGRQIKVRDLQADASGLIFDQLGGIEFRPVVLLFPEHLGNFLNLDNPTGLLLENGLDILLENGEVLVLEAAVTPAFLLEDKTVLLLENGEHLWLETLNG